MVESPAPKESKVIDLADALRRSVEAAKKSKPKRAGAAADPAGGAARGEEGQLGACPPRFPHRATVRDVVKQLDAARDRAVLHVDGHDLSVTNLDKALWPGAVPRGGRSPSGTCCAISRGSRRWMLPHLADRPLFVTRFPGGHRREELLPEALGRSARVRPHRRDLLQPRRDRRRLPHLREPPDAPLAGPDGEPRAARLVLPHRSRAGRARRTGRRFTGSEAALEQSVLNYPDFVVFDLDPYDYSGREARGRGAGAAPARVQPHPQARPPGARAARAAGAHHLRQDLGPDRAPPLPPDRARARLRRRTRGGGDDRASTRMRERPRGGDDRVGGRAAAGKIFFDYNQNSRGKSLAVPYSTAAPSQRPPCPTPVRWEELERIYPTDFTLRTVPDRLEAARRPVGRHPGGEAGPGRDPRSRRRRMSLSRDALSRGRRTRSATARSRDGSRRCWPR